MDNVNHPQHYNLSPATCECGRRIEAITILRHMDFNLGNAMKYIWRAEHKNGIEDLKKAVFCLNDYIDAHGNKNYNDSFKIQKEVK